VEKKKILYFRLREKIQQRIKRFKELHGDPHYVAMGMAIGVFVALTPTIPFHTVIAVSLAFIFKGSKAAAAVGVWLSNPATIPIFYFASYKVGAFLFDHQVAHPVIPESITTLLKLGLNVSAISIMGGVLIGIPPAIATYFITRRLAPILRAGKTLSSNKGGKDRV
jgi:uncharacterized protein (DUF2062 family)